jgi:hypothetical protein
MFDTIRENPYTSVVVCILFIVLIVTYLLADKHLEKDKMAAFTVIFGVTFVVIAGVSINWARKKDKEPVL